MKDENVERDVDSREKNPLHVEMRESDKLQDLAENKI